MNKLGWVSAIEEERRRQEEEHRRQEEERRRQEEDNRQREEHERQEQQRLVKRGCSSWSFLLE